MKNTAILISSIFFYTFAHSMDHAAFPPHLGVEYAQEWAKEYLSEIDDKPILQLLLDYTKAQRENNIANKNLITTLLTHADPQYRYIAQRISSITDQQQRTIVIQKLATQIQHAYTAQGALEHKLEQRPDISIEYQAIIRSHMDNVTEK